jgi:hypothetical protein
MGWGPGGGPLISVERAAELVAAGRMTPTLSKLVAPEP